MISLPNAHLLFNGLVVIMAGSLIGFPLRDVIVKEKREAVNAWRVAHSVLVMDGLLMLVIGLALPYFNLDKLAISVLVWSLVVSGYGFAVAFILGAWKGLRGLTAKPFGLNTLLFGAHIIGAFGSLIGIAVAIYGSLRTIL
ncbi:MAG: hypothetical protein A2157_12175 [Deltaproteobacteria bacterium RBG_16_47_11]|nr:MAG: hypothetical protein A2157_12175 [Deltaproteobacteria bacterium RBG_16_47_11]